jgi:hypothetical protein
LQEEGDYQANGTLPGDPTDYPLTQVSYERQWGEIRCKLTHPNEALYATSTDPQVGAIDKKREKFFAYVEEVVSEVLNNPSMDKDQILCKLAPIHWWLAQLMIYERGSASITELFIQSVLAAKGFPATAWVPGVLPDLDALFLPLEEFQRLYPQLLLVADSAEALQQQLQQHPQSTSSP